MFCDLQAHGLNPIPIIYGGKKPACKWSDYQTKRVTPEQCAEWDAGQYNIGIATGRISGCFVVDIDGADGEATLAGLEAKNGTLPQTVAARTGRGRHLYFKYPQGGEIRNMASRASGGYTLRGIDVRGDGGYVVAPPSVHPDGSSYEWTVSPDDMPMADAPDWLVTLFATPKKDAPLKEPSCKPNAYLDSALRGILSDLSQVVDGGRNEALNKAAFAVGQLALQGLNESEAIRRLEAQALAIGLNQAEIMPTIESGLAAGKSNPRRDTIRTTPLDVAASLLKGTRITHMVNQKAPAIDWLLEGMFPRGKVGLISAVGGVGKSTLMLELAVHGAVGRAFGYHSVFGVSVSAVIKAKHPYKTLILSAEDDGQIIWTRLQTIVNGMDLTDDEKELLSENLYVKYVGGQNFYLTKRAGQESESTGLADHIIEQCAGGGINLIVFDPLSRFRGGSENDNDDATRFINECDRICNSLNCSIMLVHHFSKASQNSQDMIADICKARGAMAIVDGSRFAMTLEQANKSNTKDVDIDAKDYGNYLRLAFPKISYGKPKPDMWLRRDDNGYLTPTFVVEKAYQLSVNVQNRIVRKIAEDARAGTQHTVTSFCDAHSGKSKMFGLSKKDLKEILQLMIPLQLRLVEPANKKRGVKEVLEVVE